MSTSSLGVSSSFLPSPPTPPTIRLPSNFFSSPHCVIPLLLSRAPRCLQSLHPSHSSSLRLSPYLQLLFFQFVSILSALLPIAPSLVSTCLFSLRRFVAGRPYQVYTCIFPPQLFRLSCTRTCWPSFCLPCCLVRELSPPPERRDRLHGAHETMLVRPFPQKLDRALLWVDSALHFPSVSAACSSIRPCHPLPSLVASLPGSLLLYAGVFSGSLRGLRGAPRRGAIQQQQQQQY